MTIQSEKLDVDMDWRAYGIILNFSLLTILALVFFQFFQDADLHSDGWAVLEQREVRCQDRPAATVVTSDVNKLLLADL